MKNRESPSEHSGDDLETQGLMSETIGRITDKTSQTQSNQRREHVGVDAPASSCNCREIPWKKITVLNSVLLSALIVKGSVFASTSQPANTSAQPASGAPAQGESAVQFIRPADPASHLVNLANPTTTTTTTTTATTAQPAKSSLSLWESFGAFDESDEKWIMRKFVHLKQRQNEDAAPPCPQNCGGGSFFQRHYEPSFTCDLEQRLGPIDELGRWFCAGHIKTKTSCIVYSVKDVAAEMGTDNAFAFENAVHRIVSPKCEIHVFGRKDWQDKNSIPGHVQFHAITTALPNDRFLLTLMEKAGHVGSSIDLLNVDCGGCEWTTYTSWFAHNVDIRQVVVRLYWLLPQEAKEHPSFILEDKTVLRNKAAATHEFFKNMFMNGYVIYHKETNTWPWRGENYDYSFIKLRTEFQQLAISPETRNPLLSQMDSQGFFVEPDEVWTKRRANHYLAMQEEHRQSRACEHCAGQGWWQNHYHATFNCPYERRIGAPGDGGKWVCDPHKINPASCLVYSIGSNGVWDFENMVHDGISEHCEIHTFDYLSWQHYMNTIGQGRVPPPDYVHYHIARLGKGPGEKTVADLIKDLGHENRTIDLLKIDCDGCEWTTFDSWFAADPVRDARQVLTEIHWDNMPKDITNKSGLANSLHESLSRRGYVVFHKEPNVIGCAGNCIEYAYLKLNTAFGAHRDR